MFFYTVEIRVTEHKGRGVFALEDIPAFSTIEVAPVIVMGANDRQYIDKTILHDYIFEWTPQGKNYCILALGYVSIYNHSFESNAEYVMDYEAHQISIISVRPILAGEEIDINYNGDWNDEKPLWFEVNS